MGPAPGAARAPALFAAASRTQHNAAAVPWTALLEHILQNHLHLGPTTYSCLAACGAASRAMWQWSLSSASAPNTASSPLPVAVGSTHHAVQIQPLTIAHSLRRSPNNIFARARPSNTIHNSHRSNTFAARHPPSLSFPGVSSSVQHSSSQAHLRSFAHQSRPMSASMPAHSERPSTAASSASGAGHHLHTNRLAREQSPYLLQHAHNPVDWYPWGEEAFRKAREEDKPIFLSVGYATCHWCHVMERESFEDEEVAALLARDFVAVKVDREERPDVDRVYMTYVQAVTGSGGWPMSVWLTPSLEPFYGGTYYPPKDRFVGGQLAVPGFCTVLRRIASLWRTNRRDLKDKAATTLAQLTEALQPEQPVTSTLPGTTKPARSPGAAAAPAGPEGAAGAGAGPSTTSLPSAGVGAAAGSGVGLSPQLGGAVVDACGADLARRYDAEYGGFGGAPKFPRPSEINLLMRAQMRQMEQSDPLGSRRLRDMALSSLRAMAAGGLYDHLGGGFHRYSVDERWHVPHFEKMLYDNPQLAATYLGAFQLTGEAAFAGVARGVLDYLLRDMTSPGGALYSAEDADSIDPHTFAPTTTTGGHHGTGPSPGRGAGAAAGEPRRGSEAGLAGVGPGTAAEGGAVTGERKEGAFYIWDKAEVMAVLGPQLGRFFCMVYGIEGKGNCTRSARSDPHGEFEGKNVPYLAVQPEVAAARLGLPYGGDPAAAARQLAAAREALHAARAARPRPSLDDKIVTAWNGLGIGAFALASRVLASEGQVERLFPSEGRPPSDYLAAARRVAAFVRQHLWEPAASPAGGSASGGGGGGGRLRRSYCRGPSAVAGFADDYAALISGLLDLYEAGGGREWLEWAVQLQDRQDELFWDPGAGGYYSTPDPACPDADPSIRIRIKDDYDGAEPAASSMSAANLLRLADLLPRRGRQEREEGEGVETGAASSTSFPRMSYGEAAQRTLGAFSSRLQQAPLAVPQMCCAAHTLSKRPLRQVIVAGLAGSPDTSSLLDAVHGPYCPDKVVLVVDPTDPRDMDFWRAHNPAAHDMVSVHFEKVNPGSPSLAPATVFICQNFTCQAPTSDPARVRELLSRQQVAPSAAQLQRFEMNFKR